MQPYIQRPLRAGTNLAPFSDAGAVLSYTRHEHSDGGLVSWYRGRVDPFFALVALAGV